MAERLAPPPAGRVSLRALAAAITPEHVRGPLDLQLTQIAYDSRHVRPGALFVALRGERTDGHRYADSAVAGGAVAVVHTSELQHYHEQVSYLRVADGPRALSRAAAHFSGHPSRQIGVIGVTGTNGKSTTAWMIHQLLGAAGIRAGLISTVGADLGAGVDSNQVHVTTPLAVEAHAMLRQIADAKASYAVLEASSHGLDLRTSRLADVRFQAGVLTNFSHDHLEFHGTREAYLDAKLNLFRSLGPPAPAGGAFGVAAAEIAPAVRAVTAAPVYAYGQLTNDRVPVAGSGKGTRAAHAVGRSSMDGAGIDRSDSRHCACTARAVRETDPGIELELGLDGHWAAARLPFHGRFNLDNSLAAASVVARLLRLEVAAIADLLPALRLPPGHLERVDRGQPFTVIVDYAHTPEAFRATLAHAAAGCRGRIIAVFGSAGERDVAKRAVQGQIACAYADLVVLTDEDCRGEDPMAILQQIAAGCRGRELGRDLVLEPDRRRAIDLAIAAAKPGDTVLLLGKGHEATMMDADGEHPWDERAAAEAALAAVGYATDGC